MCYFKLTHYLLNDCFFPNRTIPLGGKLTLNKDFSSPLSGSHPFFSSFPHIPPPSGFLILFSDLCIRIPSFPIPPSSFFLIIFLLCFFFFLPPSCLFAICYLLLFCTFLLLLFPYSCILPFLPAVSPAPLNPFPTNCTQSRAEPLISPTFWTAQHLYKPKP